MKFWKHDRKNSFPTQSETFFRFVIFVAVCRNGPPLGNMARKHCLLVCLSLGNMARKHCVIAKLHEIYVRDNVYGQETMFLGLSTFGKHG